MSNISNLNKMHNLKELKIWNKAIDLTVDVYKATASFPADERFGLTSQSRRSAVSIPSNIAEGQARHTTGEFIQFVSHAEGSVAELNTQLILATELHFCSTNDVGLCFELVENLRRMLNGLRRKLEKRCLD